VRFHESRDVFRSIVSTVEKALGQNLNPYPSLQPRDEENDFQNQGLRFASEPAWNYSRPVQSQTAPPKSEALTQPLFKETPQVIGQLSNTYILCQVRGGLLMVDQHAAHERIVYETLKNGVNNSRIEAQTLLMPYRLELTTKEKRIALKRRSQLDRFGIELDHFGGNTFLLRSVPAILKNVQWDSFFSEFITELEDDELEEGIFLDKVLTVMACHGAIRAGQSMNHHEINHLLSQLQGTEIPTNCPHGRPIFKHFTYYEIEKMFKRVI
jgi:DNA mismatch repair protein MutL